MANCLLLSSQNYACGAPLENFGEILEVKIIPSENIASSSITGRTVTWDIGTKGHALQAANNAVVLNIATKGGETYNLAFDPTITVVAPIGFYVSHAEGSVSSGDAWVIGLKFSSGAHYVVGLNSPLSLLSVEGVSNVNPNATLSFGVEDWQTGTTIYKITQAEYDKA